MGIVGFAQTSYAQGASIEGTWRTANGTEIKIAPCDSDFCGTLSWIVIPPQQSGMCKAMAKTDFGSLMLDYQNPDKSQQTRSLLGAQMLSVKATNDPNAFTASVYNAEDGSTNDVQLWVLEGNTLRIGGACLANICAVTQDWPRVADREATPDFTCDGP
ncbi:MAG: DUF2147 domain-containing protein [Devosia sp.]